MQDVRSTVLDTLNSAGYGSYSQYAEPVITALVNRERDICGVLIEYATRQGLSREQAEQALAQTGMAVPAAAPQAVQSPAMGSGATVSEAAPAATQEGSGDDVAEALSRIENTLAGLTAFARENGYTG